MHLPVPIEVLLSNRNLLLSVAIPLAALLVASIPASRWLARRTGSDRRLTFMFFLGSAGVLAATLPLQVRYYGFLHCVIENPVQAFNIRDPQNHLNIALYFPVAFFGNLIFRRPFLFAIILGSASATIEVAQMFADRACSTDDFALNVIGGIAGIVAAQTLLKSTPNVSRRQSRDDQYTKSATS